MTELASIQKGEGKLELEIKDGKVLFIVGYDGKQADAELKISLGVEEYAEMLKKAIPGKIDDTVIDLLVASMK